MAFAHSVPVAVIVQLISVPLACCFLCLGGGTLGRIARWVGVIACAAALIVATRAMLAEGAYLRVLVDRPFTAPDNAVRYVTMVVLLFDWTSAIVVGAATTAVAFAFAHAELNPRRDAWLLACLGLVSGVAVAGNPVLLWLFVTLTVVPMAALALAGSATPWCRGAASGLGVAAACFAGVQIARVILHSLTAPRAQGLTDLTTFPVASLSDVAAQTTRLLTGLGALAGLAPMCLRHGAEWEVLRPRTGAAVLAAGPVGAALAAAFRLGVHGRETIHAGVTVGELLVPGAVVAAVSIVWHLARFVRARSESCYVGVEAGLWTTYACFALLLDASGAPAGLYAYVACLLAGSCSLGGVGLAARLVRSELALPLRVVGWASLVGVPPLGGFFARFLLLRAAVEGLGPWGLMFLVPWIGEVAFVMERALDAFRSEAHMEVPAEGGMKASRRRPVVSTAWAALAIIACVVSGPVALVLADNLVRQIVAGAL